MPTGSVTFEVDVSGGDVQLDYYSVSVENVAEDIHTIILDQNDAPSITLTAIETSPNKLVCSVVLDDDVAMWELYAKQGDIPQIAGTNTWDPTYLRLPNGNRNRTQVEFYAQGAGGGVADHWFCYAVAYDKNGLQSAFSAVAVHVQGTVGTPPVGAVLSNLAAQTVGGFIEVTWVNNAVIEAAAATAYQVRITENGVPMVVQADARSAKLDASNIDSIPDAGGWRRMAAAGTSYLTFNYVVELYEAGILVGSYSVTASGYFDAGSTDIAPTGTPTAGNPILDAGSGCALAAWSGLGLSTVYSIEIEWHYSTDNFVGSDVVAQRDVLPPDTQSHYACGFSPTLWVRERRRYVNQAGNGTWTGYSTAVQMAGGILP